MKKQTLDRYKKIEEEVKKATADMEVTKEDGPSLESIIDKIVERPDEFYTKLAYELSVEERETLKRLIENRSCYNCTNESCRIEHYEKIGLDELGRPNGSNCLGWNNSELVGRQKIKTNDVK